MADHPEGPSIGTGAGSARTVSGLMDTGARGPGPPGGREYCGCEARIHGLGG